MKMQFFYRMNPHYNMIDIVSIKTGEVIDQLESMQDALEALNELTMDYMRADGEDPKFDRWGDTIS